MEFSLLEKGGVVMVILGLLSVYALAVIFYKVYQFYTANVFSTRFIDPVMSSVKRGELSEALKRLAPIRGPIARIMRTAVECVRNRNISLRSREAEIGRVGAQEIQYLESHMRGLEMVATTAPLLGLLGTVIGMVRAFAKLGEAGSRVDPSMLAGGIWEALLTTVGGLIVAIPALAAYYLIDSVIEKVRATMKDTTIQILALEDSFLSNNDEQARINNEQLLAEQRRLLSEQEKQRKELRAREESLRQAMDEQEKAVASMRSTPAGTSTLRLLNPSYTKF